MGSMEASAGHRPVGVAIRLGQRIGAIPRPVAILVSSVALGVVYTLVAEPSYRFVIPPSPNAVFWLPTGMNFALFVIARRVRWLWPGWMVALFLGEMGLGLYHRQ